jgi:hypothetical protein
VKASSQSETTVRKIEFQLIPVIKQDTERKQFVDWLKLIQTKFDKNTEEYNKINCVINAVEVSYSNNNMAFDKFENIPKKDVLMYQKDALLFQNEMDICLYTKVKPILGVPGTSSSSPNTILSILSINSIQNQTPTLFKFKELRHLVSIQCLCRPKIENNDFFPEAFVSDDDRAYNISNLNSAFKSLVIKIISEFNLMELFSPQVRKEKDGSQLQNITSSFLSSSTSLPIQRPSSPTLSLSSSSSASSTSSLSSLLIPKKSFLNVSKGGVNASKFDGKSISPKQKETSNKIKRKWKDLSSSFSYLEKELKNDSIPPTAINNDLICFITTSYYGSDTVINLTKRFLLTYSQKVVTPDLKVFCDNNYFCIEITKELKELVEGLLEHFK